jgi:hypothetical protein
MYFTEQTVQESTRINSKTCMSRKTSKYMKSKHVLGDCWIGYHQENPSRKVFLKDCEEVQESANQKRGEVLHKTVYFSESKDCNSFKVETRKHCFFIGY